MDGGVVVPHKIFYVKSYVTGSRLVLAESASRKSLIYSLYVSDSTTLCAGPIYKHPLGPFIKGKRYSLTVDMVILLARLETLLLVILNNLLRLKTLNNYQ